MRTPGLWTPDVHGGRAAVRTDPRFVTAEWSDARGTQSPVTDSERMGSCVCLSSGFCCYSLGRKREKETLTIEGFK